MRFSLLKLLFLILLGLGCSQINSKSQQHYREEKQMRHGLIPVEDNTSMKPLPEKFDSISITRGEVIYRRDCAACHGLEGRGDGLLASEQDRPVANLRQTVKEVPHFKFYMSVSQWQGTMPGWKKHYDETDREDLVAYLKTFR